MYVHVGAFHIMIIYNNNGTYCEVTNLCFFMSASKIFPNLWYAYMYVHKECITLAQVRRSIEADQGGTMSVRARVSLVSWEGGSHAVLFMVLLGLLG